MASFPLWGTAALAAIVAILAVIAILRFGSRQALGVAAASALALGLGWVALDRLDAQAKADQRRAIEARLTALNAQALLPNSNLACLDAAGGDVVHEACEKALFESPEQVATALNYVEARLDVMREIAALPDRDKAAYDSLRAPIIRSLEADRFGLVSQVLMARDACQPATCYAFDFLQRRDQLVANMKERGYDLRVARYAPSWNDKAATPAEPALAAHAGPPHTPVNIDFPTSESIPPVSIMSNEPGRPGQNGVSAPQRSDSKPQPQPQSQPQSQASAPPPSQPRPPAPRRPAPKAQAPRPAPPPVPATADPFPQPVGSAQQTTGAQPQ